MPRFELYPKQDALNTGGAGLVIRVPLGVHRGYPFVVVLDDGLLVPVGNSVAECCAWVCEAVRLVRMPDVRMVAGEEHDQDGCGYVGWRYQAGMRAFGNSARGIAGR